MPTDTTLDRDIMMALIRQVAKAVPPGRNERAVTTVISRALWRIWCRSVGESESSEPTAWLGSQDTIRVFGSETLVFESDELISASFPSSFLSLP